MKPFDSSTYLAQVKRLRKLAIEALKLFPIKNYSLEFIQHGENTTFRVKTNKKDYLLRVHRIGYHTPQALREELNWLYDIARTTDISVQVPLKSKRDQLFESIYLDEVNEPRICDILEWQHGQIRKAGLNEQSFFKMGELTAKLQKSGHNRKIKHRKYWLAQGLVGKDAKLGSTFAMRNHVSKSDFVIIEKSRRKIYSKIKKFETMNPKTIQFIHADLHFSNVVWNQGQICPIDFDDCGLGSKVYDTAVTLSSAEHHVMQRLKKSQRKSMLTNYFEGYHQHLSFSKKDFAMVPFYFCARKLFILGWLYSRRENPRLLNIFNKFLKPIVGELKQVNNLGVEEFWQRNKMSSYESN